MGNRKVTLTVTATYEGRSESREYVATVLQEAKENIVKEVRKVVLNALVGEEAHLPSVVIVYTEDGRRMTMPVKWNTYEPAKEETVVAVAGVIILIGLAALPMNRSKIGSILNYDLEFSGGTASTITFKDDQKVNDSLEKQVVKAYEKVSKSTSVQSQKVKANNQMVVKSVELNLSQRKQIENTLKKDYKVKSVTTENISSTISNEMQRDAFISVVISAICMLIYIAIRFKDVKFGSSAIIALINDVLVVFAAYSVGRLSVGGTFIACMLTIIGYSINSTIVIFDRIRENLKLQTIRTRDDIKALVNQSISSTLVRTINTSLTTFVMVLALFICGVSSLREFALALMVGVIGGAFSSVFLTGPLWYMMKTRIGSDAVKENQAASQAQPEKITANPNRKKKKKKKRK